MKIPSLTCFFILVALCPAFTQQKIPVVNMPLAQELIKIFPDIASGYIDFSGNGKPDQTSDLNEYVSESRVRDGQFQVQELLDFIISNWRFITLDKLKAVKVAVNASNGALSELIAIDYAASLDEALGLREAMGDGLYLTPSAYKEAMSRIGGIVSAMAAAYKKEGSKSESDFTTARDSLFGMIEKGYPLPQDLPKEEKDVLSTSMTSVILKEQSSNPQRTRTAIRVLGLLKSVEAGPYLVDLAAGTAFPVEAMKALGEIGYRPAIGTIASQLKASGSLEVRKAAFQATGAIGGAEALDAILDIVKPTSRDSLTPDLLEASVQALAGIAQKGNTDPRILASLKDLVGSPRPGIRRIAAGGLGAFNNAQSYEPLQALVIAEKDLTVRKAAIVALNRQTNEGVVAVLLRVLAERDLDPGLKTLGLKALGENPGGAKGVQILVESLSDGDEGVRASASAGLKKLFPGNQVLVTGSLARSLNTSTVESFLVEGTSLLASLADPASIPTLQILLGKPVPEVKRMAAWALYRIRSAANPKVVEELQKLVTNESEGIAVRVTAVKALGAMGFDSPQINLWQTLVTTSQMRGEKYAMLRYTAVQALGNLLPMKPQSAAALLRTATKDTDQELRKEAVSALRKAGSLEGTALDTLAGSFIEAGDGELKVRIIETLADLGSEKVLEISSEFLSGEPSLGLKRRVIASVAQSPSEQSAALILDGAKDVAAGDYITAVLESYPRKLISSIVARRLRTETDKNILSVLNSLDASMVE